MRASLTAIPVEANGKDGHLLHLKALVHKEQHVAYQRHNYLSQEWQMGLWKKALKEIQLGQLPTSADVLNLSHSVLRAPSITCVRWREKTIEWQYHVVDKFDLDREIVSISTFYLDQYLSMNFVDEELFQLVSMTSIYLAIKIHSPKKVTMNAIANAGSGLITARHIEAMELSIMKCLDWHLLPPTSVAYIDNFFPILSACCSGDFGKVVDAFEFSRFLVELSVCEYPFLCAKPSSIAIAAILHSLDHFNLPSKAREAFQASVVEASLDEKAPEVEVCSKLLRHVYKLAMPDDISLSGG